MKILKLIFIILVFNNFLFATVVLRSSNNFIENEPFIFEYEVSGSSVKFPKIEKVDQYLVEELGTSRSLQIVNGNYSENITKKYRIYPTKEFEIPSFEFEIDGNIEKSDKKTISKKTALKTQSNLFDLSIESSNKNLFVGESTVLKLTFKYRRDLQITNLDFQQPHFENFWYKRVENKNNRYEQNGYIIQELEYLLFPQKSGTLKINPLKVDVQMIDSNSSRGFGFFTAVPKIVKVYSNQLNFEVKPLPPGVNLIGDFDIKAKVDKTKINQGESVSYKLTIDGFGNFDDIEDRKLHILGATIYDNKPKIDTKYENNSYMGHYEKIYSIVPSNSITIPAQTIRYFDKKSQKIVEKKTKEFEIEVLQTQKKEENILQKNTKTEEIQKENVVSKIALKDKIIYFTLGVVVTLLIFGLINFVKIKKVKKNRHDTPLIKQIKNARDKRDLLKVLVPFINKDEKLDELIFKCEKEGEFKLLKQDIIQVVKNLKI